MTDFQKGALLGVASVLLPIGYGLFLAWVSSVSDRLEEEQRRTDDGPAPARRAGM